MAMSIPTRIPTTRTDEDLDDLFERFLDRAAQDNGGHAPPLKDWVDLAEAWRIVHALRQTRGNRSEAARQLGIGRRTLYTKMEKLGIESTFTLRNAEES
jgi:transcriptional regulator of acetoin/glycerol metabolism